VARLLLFGALALAAAANAGAAGRAPSVRCKQSQVAVSVRTQGVATTAWIGLTVRNRSATCSLGGSAVFTIQQAGRQAAVKGNPLKLPVQGPLGRGHTRLVKAGWSNWCGARRQLKLIVQYAGLTRRTTFDVLPVCIDRRRLSRLAPID
jgi:hypothetical protein